MASSRSFHPVDRRRRGLAAVLAMPVLAGMPVLHAQGHAPVVIGWLSAHRHTSMLEGFIQGMAALGWKLGASYVIEERYADGRIDRLPALAQELAAKKPAVIVALPSEAVRVAARVAPTTPIVRADGDSPLTGLVQSLARPGGMVTGVSSQVDDATEKVIELLLETMPRLQRVGILADPTSGGRDANVDRARRAAERLRFNAIVVDATGPDDIEPAMARLAQGGAQALVILPNTSLRLLHSKIMQVALARRWPVVGASPSFAQNGGLFGYGANAKAGAQRPAYFVDRILKGARPGDLPMEQPTTFDLVINLKVARQLGITMPQSMLVRASEVIE